MKNIDLTGYSIDELKSIRQRIDSEIRERGQREIAEIRTEIYKAVSARGYKVSEIISGLPDLGKSTQNKYEAGKLYVCPTNPEVTWKAKGRVPNWLREYIASGGEFKDCLAP